MMKIVELLEDAIRITNKKFVEIDEEKVTIFGDVHGDYQTLKKLMEDREGTCVFLGDYEDRGAEALEVYEEILTLYVNGEAFLLKGNHETGEAFPHDFPELLRERGIPEAYDLFRKFWERLPIFAIYGDVFLCHGGVPTKSCSSPPSLRELKRSPEEFETEILWNDPIESNGCYYNFERGVGYLFGRDITGEFCESNGFKCVIRSHQPYKVLQVEQGGLLITVGSTAIPYGLTSAAIIKMNKKESYSNASDIARKFGVVREIL